MPASAPVSPASPVKRIGRNRFLRNVLIAIGNAGPDHPELRATAERCLDDAAPLVRAAAAWALSRVSPSVFRNEREARLEAEPDELVRTEWEREPDAA